jgi:hypothetical protein
LRLEHLRFYLGLIRYPWTRAHGRRALGLAILLVLSQLATAAGALAESIRGDDRRPHGGSPAAAEDRL